LGTRYFRPFSIRAPARIDGSCSRVGMSQRAPVPVPVPGADVAGCFQHPTPSSRPCAIDAEGRGRRTPADHRDVAPDAAPPFVAREPAAQTCVPTMLCFVKVCKKCGCGGRNKQYLRSFEQILRCCGGSVRPFGQNAESAPILPFFSARVIWRWSLKHHDARSPQATDLWFRTQFHHTSARLITNDRDEPKLSVKRG